MQIPQFTTKKQKGEWAELMFMQRAAALGLTVSKPMGESARYDVMVEQAGCTRRVQVKARAAHNSGTYVVVTKTQAAKWYTAAEVDVIAVLVIPEDAWYLIPIRVFARHTWIALRPAQRGSARGMERYREAWHLLLPRKNPCHGKAR
jgi:PD-(D/E)XK endonuclease